MSASYPRLFSPLTIRGHEIRNRILSTGHQTYLAQAGLPGEDFIAYHAARARGGVGLIVTEAARFHSSSMTQSPDLVIVSDDAIGHYARLASAVHEHGARIIGQLSHAGRVSRRMQNGMRGVVFAPSSVPENRFHTVPREMPTEMVTEIVAALAEGARRYIEAGYDGVELMASHGLLFAQFLNPASNLRKDCYGGSLENRMRALRESLIAARSAIGAGPMIGLRISADELDEGGLDQATVLEACRDLSAAGLVDYVNTTVGTMAALGASVHVVPPMEIAPAYVAEHSRRIRAVVTVPVFVAGRINQPQIAEEVLAAGQADMCAMTRALITDPEMPNKAHSGRSDDIRACIGCNQACIGHFHAGQSISCIQNPITGREVRLAGIPQSSQKRKILIAGAGPAGMKAAITAAQMGHKVILAEAGPQAGGQALLAQLLPERAEFGGLVTNLLAELAGHDVDLRLNTRVSAELAARIAPDALILATGSKPVETPVEGRDSGNVIEACDLLAGRARPGARVVVADWRCDWIGIGIAVLLQRAGHHVRLAVNGIAAGQNLQQYVRDHWAGRLHEAGIEVIPYARLFGIDDDNAYFLHGASGQPTIMEGVDSLILCSGRAPDAALEQELGGCGLPFITIGDCTIARSAEEAIYDGLVEVRGFLDALDQKG
ncbi:2,4-dienoyl-CoA reductase-like NADH-dependent reductase (Old Yellow Enzyme family) [Pseudaminobacter salicylatoxidans]|uniref:2,4-dienoyl-CoA reductase-like NADH-dependent reductase (Old Yellow Enzyme family) n=1 Tax=Pseudaminobacter salicylatoxidans TaxID=93369 RepID=A0A316C1G2_PSESE|nr:FAD-dependent oxidoreductase [Pseudaminobacter salicylatoxidans]PWJ82407.1 2,4-dienoyl-CoA reductase-like NADH-dependent reductase (Old Yellow Enzyme family) [Pseudaminobacter salicylatoxidans]